MIRVLVADDQPLISAGISYVLATSNDIEVVAQTATDGVMVMAEAHHPDVVVMDVEPNGADLIGKIIACGVPRVLVLSAHHTVRLVCDALGAGASGYLLKATAPALLVSAVRAINDTGTWLDPTVVTDLLQELTRQPITGESTSAVLDRLTPREQEVLILMAHGLSNAEMADQLFISSLTVRTHVGRVLTKLGARNRAHAVTTAYRLGLVRIAPVAQ